MIPYDEASETVQEEANLILAYFIRHTVSNKDCGGLGIIRSDWQRLTELEPDLESRIQFLYQTYKLRQLEAEDEWKSQNRIIAFYSYESFKARLMYCLKFANQGGS